MARDTAIPTLPPRHRAPLNTTLRSMLAQPCRRGARARRVVPAKRHSPQKGIELQFAAQVGGVGAKAMMDGQAEGCGRPPRQGLVDNHIGRPGAGVAADEPGAGFAAKQKAPLRRFDPVVALQSVVRQIGPAVVPSVKSCGGVGWQGFVGVEKKDVIDIFQSLHRSGAGCAVALPRQVFALYAAPRTQLPGAIG